MPHHRPDQDLDEILHALTENMTVTVSGERLARDLGLSHSKVVRLVDRLRGEGAEILGTPFSGFRLMRLPDILIPRIISGRLHTGAFGRELYHLYETGSTNSFALELLANSTVEHGAVVLAEKQTAGRGRRGRSWVSVSNVGLYMTIILKPTIPCSLAPLMTLGAAVAAHEAIERITDLDVDVKWPNDLLVGKKKVAGVLSELQAELDQVHSMIIGMGINVNHESMPAEISGISSSLRMEAGRSYSRSEILLDFLAAFERLYASFLEKGPASIVDRWIQSSSFATGRRLEVHDGTRRISGTTEGLNALGALKVRQLDGRVEEIYSGDVISWE